MFCFLDYGELFAALQRLQLQLTRAGVSSRTLDPVHNLFQRSSFHRTLSIHNKVQQVWTPTTMTSPVLADSKSLITEVSSRIRVSIHFYRLLRGKVHFF